MAAADRKVVANRSLKGHLFLKCSSGGAFTRQPITQTRLNRFKDSLSEPLPR